MYTQFPVSNRQLVKGILTQSVLRGGDYSQGMSSHMTDDEKDLKSPRSLSLHSFAAGEKRSTASLIVTSTICFTRLKIDVERRTACSALRDLLRSGEKVLASCDVKPVHRYNGVAE